MTAKAVSRAQLHVLEVIAAMGDVSSDPRARIGLRIAEHTLRSLERLGLIKGDEAQSPRADGSMGSRSCWILTPEGSAYLKQEE